VEERKTVAQVLADAFVRHGVKRIFGIPGGGSSLDLIRACSERGIPFILTRTEAAAAIMACVTADLSGSIGVVLTTLGPGTASVANGVAYSRVDRSPLIVISDGWSGARSAYDTHQRFDQAALMAPITKAHSRLDGDDVANEIESLVAVAKALPRGPVYLELSSDAAARLVPSRVQPRPNKLAVNTDEEAIAAARDLIAASKRPVVLVGLEACDADIGAAVLSFVERLGCPVLPTYKAKGVVSDHVPNVVGLFTGALAERECVGKADLIIQVAFDPVELTGRPWTYTAPVIDIALKRHEVNYVEPKIGIYQPVEKTLRTLLEGLRSSAWQAGEISALRASLRQKSSYPVNTTLPTSQSVVVDAIEAARRAGDVRIAVDAGAHMFSPMAFWESRRANDVLISNGLATMAFALPAGIAASLQEPERPVIAFTGDGGLMMCAGELSTASQYRSRLCVVVLNDGALSMISLKQRARQLPSEGVEWPMSDFARVADGFGVKGFRADTAVEFRQSIEAALAHDGPTLIDARVDASGYADQSLALRG
jgi:acetolactate synthase-1/2/3 large subunit